MKNWKLSALLCAILGLSAGSVMAEAVYSCGEGCYTSRPSRGQGKADLGHRIGSYTSTMPPVESVATPAETRVTRSAVVRPVAAHVIHRGGTVVARSMPAVAMASPAAPAMRSSSARASGRRTILEQELSNERSALAQAQKALADGRAVGGRSDANHQNRVRQLESAVLDRQQNIQALQRELSRM